MKNRRAAGTGRSSKVMTTKVRLSFSSNLPAGENENHIEVIRSVSSVL